MSTGPLHGLPPSPGQQHPYTQQQLPYPTPDIEPSNRPPVTRRRVILPALTSIIGAVVGAGVTLAIMLPLTDTASNIPKALLDTPGSKVLSSAAEACGLPMGVNVQDDGATLVFDHEGEDDFAGGEIADIMCVFTELDMPARIRTHMGQTTSMDGRQTASWDSLEVQWSYHPDRGMDGMIVVTSE